MSITFPTTLDSLPNPIGTDLMENAIAALDHDVQHSNANDAIEALEAKVGINSSAVTTSHDYKLSAVTSTAKALTSGTSTQSVTNLTLVTPTLTIGSDATGDMYYRNSGGTLSKLALGTTGQVVVAGAGGVPEYTTIAANQDASTTVKGVSEEATLAETLARTAAGGTSARLFVNPTNLTTVQTYDYAADAGGTDAYAITVSPAPTAYVTGQIFTFKANTANTGACTLNVNSLGAKSIKINGIGLVTGDILANRIITVVYDGTDFVIKSNTGVYSNNTSIYEVVASSNTRDTNSASVIFPSTTTPIAYTKFKETVYNDIPGVVNVTYTIGLQSGSGTSTPTSRLYINGVAVGTANAGNGTYTDSNVSVNTGDLVQIYAYVSSYTSGTLLWNVNGLLIKYDKQLKVSYVAATSVT